jgi:hypothetical protein
MSTQEHCAIQNEITDFLSLINGTVYDKTKGDQSPWYNNSIRGIFKF